MRCLKKKVIFPYGKFKYFPSSNEKRTLVLAKQGNPSNLAPTAGLISLIYQINLSLCL